MRFFDAFPNHHSPSPVSGIRQDGRERVGSAPPWPVEHLRLKLAWTFLSLPEHFYHCLNIFIIVWTFAFVISTFHFFIFTKLVLQIGELVGEGLNDGRVPVSKDHESLNAIDWRDKSYILETLTMSWGLPHQGPWGPGILGRKRTYIYTSLPGPPLSSIFTLQTLCL